MKFIICSVLINLLFWNQQVFAGRFESIVQLQSKGFSDYELVNTDSDDYFLKRLMEEIRWRFAFSKQVKANLLVEFWQRRFNELIYIANEEKLDLLENATQRYNTFSGRVVDNPEALRVIKDKTSQNIDILKSVIQHYRSDSPYRMMIQQSLDTTERLL